MHFLVTSGTFALFSFTYNQLPNVFNVFVVSIQSVFCHQRRETRHKEVILGSLYHVETGRL